MSEEEKIIDLENEISFLKNALYEKQKEIEELKENTIRKDKIKEELKDLKAIQYSAKTDIGQAVYNANIRLLERLLEE